MSRKAETASVAETETVPTMPGLPLSGATETVTEEVKVYYCQTCGKTRFVEWPHRNCPPDYRP